MKIVIDIDENLYTRLFDNGETNVVDMLKACVAIRNGTPLPNGHGRLIDADELERDLRSNDWITNDDGGGLEDILHNSSTIIEADTEK